MKYLISLCLLSAQAFAGNCEAPDGHFTIEGWNAKTGTVVVKSVSRFDGEIESETTAIRLFKVNVKKADSADEILALDEKQSKRPELMKEAVAKLRAEGFAAIRSVAVPVPADARIGAADEHDIAYADPLRKDGAFVLKSKPGSKRLNLVYRDKAGAYTLRANVVDAPVFASDHMLETLSPQLVFWDKFVMGARHGCDYIRFWIVPLQASRANP